MPPANYLLACSLRTVRKCNHSKVVPACSCAALFSITMSPLCWSLGKDVEPWEESDVVLPTGSVSTVGIRFTEFILERMRGAWMYISSNAFWGLMSPTWPLFIVTPQLGDPTSSLDTGYYGTRTQYGMTIMPPTLCRIFYTLHLLHQLVPTATCNSLGPHNFCLKIPTSTPTRQCRLEHGHWMKRLGHTTIHLVRGKCTIPRSHTCRISPCASILR